MTAAANGATEFHYVITIQIQDGPATGPEPGSRRSGTTPAIQSASGVVDVTGKTREQMFAQVISALKTKHSFTTWSLVFWSLEPNRLPGGAL
ncbi:hypothetical protein [Thermomonospora umbrina]|uniref:Uncharacterized protein n=1 Tax=Thermomonospora umbrina TaxID=111806 RepID=A0A3D9SWL9_9ACTN|nr:hypothetical protein [Thermomonospora umbrina]REF00353.1 hypothetical protein DFJ69_5885 [Thermomonospora umbrina]